MHVTMVTYLQNLGFLFLFIKLVVSAIVLGPSVTDMKGSHVLSLSLDGVASPIACRAYSRTDMRILPAVGTEP